MNVIAIIPAAGQGKRFGAAKQFQSLGGKPLLLYTLEAFEKCGTVQGICLVVPEQEIKAARTLLAGLKKVHWIVAGGAERQESVAKGFRVLPSCELVVVHDGARPFVTPDSIEKVIQAAGEWGGAVVGLPLKETVKEIGDDRRVVKTVDRTLLWSIQTPQAFRYEILQRALRQADTDRFVATDEAMLVEKIGQPVKVVEGSPLNIKITTPDDLELAESLLRKGRR